MKDSESSYLSYKQDSAQQNFFGIVDNNVDEETSFFTRMMDPLRRAGNRIYEVLQINISISQMAPKFY